MTLRSAQSEFVLMVADLITWVYSHQGWELTFGEAYRSDEQAEIHALGPHGRRILVDYLSLNQQFFDLAQKIANNTGNGIRGSLHEKKLAIDLNFFINDVYQSTSEAYRPLGEHWERQGGSWGGRFDPPDGNHFSLAWGGVK